MKLVFFPQNKITFGKHIKKVLENNYEKFFVLFSPEIIFLQENSKIKLYTFSGIKTDYK